MRTYIYFLFFLFHLKAGKPLSCVPVGRGGGATRRFPHSQEAEVRTSPVAAKLSLSGGFVWEQSLELKQKLSPLDITSC